MNKKQQMLDFLQEYLFAPVIHSPYTSSQLKSDFDHTWETLQSFSEKGILAYVWNILACIEIETVISNRLMDEGFNNFNQIIDTFKHEFTYEWLSPLQ